MAKFRPHPYSVFIRAVACLLFLWTAPTSFARPKSRFAEFPAERTALAGQLASKALARREQAEAWAKTNGVSMRIDNGRQLKELVAIRNGKPLYVKTLNANAAISTAADAVRQTAPYNLDGAGIRVGIWDGGSVLTTHQEFGSRISNQDGAATHYHATHAGGTIAASGVVSSAKGMAPAVSLDSYDWYSDTEEITTAGASGPGQSSAVYLSNHSYTYDTPDSSYYYLFGLYTADHVDMDLALSGLQYCLPFAAAGNERDSATYKSGYDTISYLGIAKNVMTVGAVSDAVSGGIRSLNSASMLYFSSWGPADDGRIKPDIVANGYSLYSCDSDSNSDYAYRSGTSMATPNACGSAALLAAYYSNQTSGGAIPASTLKGLIIHTADDLGNTGPDYSYGWGLMNTLEAAALIRDYCAGNTNRIVEGELSSTGMSRNYTVSSPGTSPLRLTLCWTDQPGLSDGSSSDNRSPDLVNDLDLKVTAPNGTVYYPYKLSYADPSAPATTGSENSVDNVEQIYIADPLPGSYTVTVDCDEALRYYSQKRVTASLKTGGTQSYSLLISGLTADLDGDGIPNDWEALYFGGETNATASADPDGDGTDNLTEYVAGTDPTDPDSAFEAALSRQPATNATAAVITWNAEEGRIYNVGWSDTLVSPVFTNNYSVDLPYPANSYTDSVQRAGSRNFYRVDVRLDQ